MDFRLLGAKPLPEPIQVYYQLAYYEQISVKFEPELSFKYAFENVVCQNGSCFVQEWWVKKCMSNYTPQKTMDMITYPCP